MKSVWGVLLKVVVWGLGHKEVLARTAADAATKNIPGLVNDGAEIATDIAEKK